MSGFDQLFDRFGDLLRSWTQSDDDPHPFGTAAPFGKPRDPFADHPSADPLFDEALDELNAFLDGDREEQERLRAEREERERHRAESQRYGAGGQAGGYGRGDGPGGTSGSRGTGAHGSRPSEADKLTAARRTLGVAPDASFDQIKATYKRLLKQHHPDRHGTDPEAMRRATETSARINDAFRILETWHETGTTGDE